MLGALAAAALAPLIPWKPRAADIIIATELPDELATQPNGLSRATLDFNEEGGLLYNRYGQPVAYLTEVETRCEPAYMGEDYGFARYGRGRMETNLRATVLPDIVPILSSGDSPPMLVSFASR